MFPLPLSPIPSPPIPSPPSSFLLTVGSGVDRGLAVDEDGARQDRPDRFLGHNFDEIHFFGERRDSRRVGQRREQHTLVGVEGHDLVGFVGRQLLVPLGEEGGDLGLGGVGAGLGRLRGGGGEREESFFRFVFFRWGVSRSF